MSARPRNLWPWLVGLMLGIVVLANVALLFIAHRARPILESDQAYAEGLDHEAVLRARRAARALGWRGEIQLSRGHVVYRMYDADGRPVRGLSGVIVVQRGDTRAHDTRLTVSEHGPGTYRAEWRRPPGSYRLDVRLEGGPTAWMDQQMVRSR